MFYKEKLGFTIVELLIVVVVIAILAAVVIVSYNGISARAEENGLKSDLISQSKRLETEKIKSGAINTSIVESFRSIQTNNATISYKYGDLTSQCLEITSIKTPAKQYYIDSAGNISQTANGACPPPSSNVELRCPAGRIVIIVQQTNYTPSNATFTFTTPLGSSTSGSIAPGATTSSTAFTAASGVSSIAAGVATVQVTSSTNAAFSTTRFHPYPAYSC